MTSDQDITATLIQIFKEEAQVNLSHLDESATLSDLDVASIDMVMVLYRIEDDLGVVIDPAKNGPNTTIGELKRQIMLNGRTAG